MIVLFLGGSILTLNCLYTNYELIWLISIIIIYMGQLQGNVDLYIVVLYSFLCCKVYAKQ